MIAAENRNDVRIIELPACKMIWSDVCKDGSSVAESEQLRRFNQWWTAQDKYRRDRFYARDFMWYDSAAGGMAWGLAVAEVPTDTSGYEIMDFTGGLYAVANYADNDAGGAYESIKKWVKESGCFAPDENRNHLWHFISTEAAREAMKYHQYDFYFPISVKGEGNERTR